MSARGLRWWVAALAAAAVAGGAWAIDEVVPSVLRVSTALILGPGATQEIATCDTRGNTVYPLTCNQLGGLATIGGGAGGTPFSISNGLALGSTGICTATLLGLHAGCSSIYCQVTAGTLTFQTNANCTTTSQDFSWTLQSRQ